MLDVWLVMEVGTKLYRKMGYGKRVWKEGIEGSCRGEVMREVRGEVMREVRGEGYRGRL